LDHRTNATTDEPRLGRFVHPFIADRCPRPGSVSALSLAVGRMAGFVPARHTARIDPIWAAAEGMIQEVGFSARPRCTW
jgi:hypothetical protein